MARHPNKTPLGVQLAILPMVALLAVGAVSCSGRSGAPATTVTVQTRPSREEAFDTCVRVYGLQIRDWNERNRFCSALAEVASR
jgi:hypothetical protein